MAERKKNEHTEQKFEVHFQGSDHLKSQFPKSFALVEEVANDWVKDGDFKNLPIEQPLVQFYVGEGLRKVKAIEQTVKPLIEGPIDKFKKLLKFRGL